MEATFFIGMSRGILEIFCKKIRGPPTSKNGLVHDQIPTEKHLAYEALLGSKLENKLCYGVRYFIRPNCRIMLERCMEFCSALLTSIY